MATFRAHNIDYESDASEVEDTTELQIEEAHKLYQTALKFHSEGPPSFEKAQKAYQELFESDIFKYAESLSEFRRWETLPEYDELLLQSFDPTAQTTIVAGDSAPNTLPQILHLAYKNHGQFILDVLCHRIRETVAAGDVDGARPDENVQIVNAPLNHFAEALDKDDSDVDLWRRTAQVARWAGSVRIARFALEAVLDGEIEALEVLRDTPGIDQMLAQHQIRKLATELEDDLSMLSAPLNSTRKTALSAALRKLINSYPDLHEKSFELSGLSLTGNTGKAPVQYVIMAATRDWLGIGNIISQQLMLEESGVVDTGPGFGVGFKLPPSEVTAGAEDIQMAIEGASLGDEATLTSETVAESPTQIEDNPAEQAPEAMEIEQPDTQPTEPPIADTLSKDSQPIDPQSSNTGAAPAEEQSVAMSRKRSTDSAGLPEVAEGGRSRSKRTRTRWTTSGERIDTTQVETVKDNVANEQLEQFTYADNIMDETIRPILSRLNIQGLIAPNVIGNIVKEEESSAQNEEPLRLAIKDLFEALKLCEPRTVESLQTDSFSEQSVGVASRQAGLNVFLGHETLTGSDRGSRPILPPGLGLQSWVDKVNKKWCINKDAAWSWLSALLRPTPLASNTQPASLYAAFVWPDGLKEVVRRIAAQADSYIFTQAQASISAIESRLLKNTSNGERFNLTPNEIADAEMIQSLFEIHVDIHANLKAAGYAANPGPRLAQRKCLESWSMLANVAIQLARGRREVDDLSDLDIRHIWAHAHFVVLDENTPQEFILVCIKDLRKLMRSFDGRIVHLPNNETMPEISIEAVEATLRRMNMKDFFLKIFSDDQDDEESAVVVIEGLEPLLNAAESLVDKGKAAKSKPTFHTTSEQDNLDDQMELERMATNPTDIEEVAQFIATSSLTLRLALWRRLRDAYTAVPYKPMVVYCDFKTIELLINELMSEDYSNLGSSQRTNNLLRWLRLIDDLIARTLALRADNPDFLECIDADQVKRSMSSLASLCSLLHSSRLLDDQVSVGSLQTPGPSNRGHAVFANLSARMNDMNLRAWTLQYLLLKDAIEQYSEMFPAPSEDRLSFLRAIHFSTGTRGVCNSANKLLLKLEKDELLELSDLPDASLELCQVLYDLYGLKCFQHALDMVDHECIDLETLSRKEALKILGFMLVQADKYSIKDLPKTDLKVAIDRVQEALGKPRPSESAVMNKKICSGFIKGPVNPLNLYNGFKGNLSLPSKAMTAAENPVAATGWYFLLGNISLNKFRSQKRLTAGSTEDLDAAAAYFLEDLQYSTEQWQTWYRLGQTYDTHVEECVSWSAEKINGQTNEINAYQRHAINCYAMAVSCVVRHGIGEESTKVAETVSQLFSDFGTRIYASTRDPFSMRAFLVRENEEKFYNRVWPAGGAPPLMYRAPAFTTMKLFGAWRYCASLYREAIKRRPDKWMNYFMLGKCLWKMFTAPDEMSGKHKPTVTSITDTFVRAIEALPSTGSRKQDPVIEPHYKLVSIVHKLVNRGALDVEAGSTVLSATNYADKVAPPANMDGWEGYILAILKNLRNADKAGWHHRMTVRASHIIYEGSGKDLLGAMGAQHELTQQTFTKTMALQVWKPEHERPGRHFVYTTRYVRFFIELLEKTGDRANYELLVRRLRKKVNDYCEHKELWLEVGTKYLKMLRHAAEVPVGYEDIIFKTINHEEFLQRATALDDWCAKTPSNNTLDLLREVVELKKLNASYMKGAPIDDLMADIYAQLYQTVALTLSIGAGSSVKAEADDATGIAEPSSKSSGRAKGVGRRELTKRAEAAGTMAAPLSARATDKETPMDRSLLMVRRPRNGSEHESGPDGASGGGDGISAKASVMDDADDESELSDIEEPEDIEDIKDSLNSPLRKALEAEQAAREQEEHEDEEEEEEGDEEQGNEGQFDGEEGDGEEMEEEHDGEDHGEHNEEEDHNEQEEDHEEEEEEDADEQEEDQAEGDIGDDEDIVMEDAEDKAEAEAEQSEH
ncbi:hypothetical protein BT63DRAFT_382587 [Microthyrium microscopicum]|uniref:Histone transcription regulator 3 homolog n=1 Tax=Microthyrium microscopicum TaxID=703497 RepID=A0A6A6ULN1_9PEZI|nr:hypothetical protein BT63DRAFT_382587 [Microthyrium microscopicum]